MSHPVSPPKAPAGNSGKVVPLEAIRGVAALVVVLFHFMSGFTPRQLIVGSPLFAAMNGNAAVSVFFVLSGFVLPLGCFTTGDTDILVRAAAKRWLRLVCLVFLATLSSYLLFKLGLYRYREAAQLTGADWLRTFAGADPHGTLTLSLRDAIMQGTLRTFLSNTNTYDVVLWTMYHEFWTATLVAAVFFVVLLGVSVLFAHIDEAWLRFINRRMRGLVGPS